MMSCWPVVLRELRAESRNRLNYWSRVAVVGAVLLLWLFAIGLSSFSPNEEGLLFIVHIHVCVFFGIVFLVPVMAADCLSREKREGTLGLLFLTPLTPGGVVIAKSLTHAIRGLTIIVAAVPALTVPFLMGGVDWNLVAFYGLIELSSLLLALSAGIVASALSVRWQRSLLAAWAWFFVFIFFAGCFFCSCFAAKNTSFSGLDPGPAGLVSLVFRIPYTFSGISYEWLQVFAGSSSSVVDGAVRSAGSTVLFSSLVVILAGSYAAAATQRAWHEEPPSARQLWWLITFCTPQFWRSIFRRKMTNLLDQNPIRWLHEYSWSARLGRWGWCLALILIDCFMLLGYNPFDDLMNFQIYYGFWLMLVLGFSAAGSFMRERQNGALELLLVTPLSDNDIVYGRIWSMWKQFVPAGVLLLATFITVPHGIYRNNAEFNVRLFQFSTFCSLPFVGLYFSLKLKSFLGAFLLTMLVGILVPYWLIVIPFPLFHRAYYIYNSDITIVVVQLLVLLLFLKTLLKSMRPWSPWKLGGVMLLLGLVSELVLGFVFSVAGKIPYDESNVIWGILAQVALLAWFRKLLFQNLRDRKFAFHR